MSIPQAVSQVIEVENMRQGGVVVPERSFTTALWRTGGGPDNQRIVCGTVAQLRERLHELFGEPLYSLVMVGRRLHYLEAEYVAAFAVDATSWKEVAQNIYGQVS